MSADEAYAALRAERERHNALYARDLATWTDDELTSELEQTYGPVAVPPCPLCGRARELQAIGGGKHKWACSGVDSGVPDWEHYGRSTFEDYKCGGDERVTALIARYRASEQDAQNVRDVAAVVRSEDAARIAELERQPERVCTDCAEANALAEKWMMKALASSASLVSNRTARIAALDEASGLAERLENVCHESMLTAQSMDADHAAEVWRIASGLLREMRHSLRALKSAGVIT